MKKIKVIKENTNEVVLAIEEDEDGIKGISADGYKVLVDGEEPETEKQKLESDSRISRSKVERKIYEQIMNFKIEKASPEEMKFFIDGAQLIIESYRYDDPLGR